TRSTSSLRSVLLASSRLQSAVADGYRITRRSVLGGIYVELRALAELKQIDHPPTAVARHREQANRAHVTGDAHRDRLRQIVLERGQAGLDLVGRVGRGIG